MAHLQPLHPSPPLGRALWSEIASSDCSGSRLHSGCRRVAGLTGKMRVWGSGLHADHVDTNQESSDSALRPLPTWCSALHHHLSVFTSCRPLPFLPPIGIPLIFLLRIYVCLESLNSFRPYSNCNAPRTSPSPATALQASASPATAFAPPLSSKHS